MNVMVEEAHTLNARWYFQTLAQIVKKPSAFFEGLPKEAEFRQPFLYLFISSLVCSAGSLTQGAPDPISGVMASLVNALTMPFIIAAIGYVPLRMFLKKEASYTRYFSVCAYASGTFLLLAWMPAFLWFTEVTKWMFIGIGLVRSHGLKRWQALLIVIISVFVTTVLFLNLTQMIMAARNG